MGVVVDTSVLIAILFDEPRARDVARVLEVESHDLVMSTVNLTEVLILLRDRSPQKAPDIERKVYASGIAFLAPTMEDAACAAHARLTYPINLGDCFVYALAKRLHFPVLTLDQDFLKTDIPVYSF